MSLGYKIMKNLIKSGRQSKEQLLEKCDVYFGAGRMSDREYEELVALINEMK